MLVSFKVKNFKSFAEEQIFSLASGSSSRKSKNFSFETHNSYAPSLLRSSCIFGANGSGKTSLITAIDFFKEFVISSAKQSQEGESIDVTPHLLDPELRGEPSEFEIIFIHNQNLYQYGFSVSQKRVWAEWLFSKPSTEKSRIRTLFQREFSDEGGGYFWDINQTLIKGEKEVWKKSTRSNALFLSQAVQLNAEDFKEPFEWIQKHLRVVESPQRMSPAFTAKQCVEEGWKSRVVSLMQSAGINIDDIEIETKEADVSEFVGGMSRRQQELILNNSAIKKVTAFSINALHKDRVGKLIPLDMDDESDGTNVIFGMAGPWLDVLEHGYTLIVDEMHNSLHPHAFKTLINMFVDPKINKNNAQIIFTSHETSVMTRGFMHQDQIWLAEKGDNNSTHLIPLSDYQVRDINNFQKAYLDGRYGGIPKLKAFIDVR